MRDVMQKMGRHGVIFSVGLLLSRLVGFILMPILTRTLGREPFGIHDLLALTGQLVAMAAALGLPSAVFRWYVYEAKSDEERLLALRAGFRSTAITTLAVGSVAALFAVPIARALTGADGYAHLFLLVLLTYFLSNLRNVCIAILRAEYRSTQFLTVYSAEFLVCVALNLYFVVVRDMGVAGLIWSNLIGSAVALGLALRFERRVLGGLLGLGAAGPLRAMLRFSLPLVPQAIAFFLLDTLDRYCFTWLLPADVAREQVGLYGRGATFASILHAVMIMPLATLWPNVFYELAKRDSGPRDIGRCTSYYAAVAGFLAVGLAVVARPLVQLMTDAQFHACHVVVPILALSIVAFGANEFTRAGFLIRGKTHLLPFLVFGAVVVNVGLNVVLIPRLGLVGAAWSSVAAYVVLLVASDLVGRRLYRVEYEWSRLLRVVLVAAVLVAIDSAVAPGPSTLAELLVRGTAAAVLFPAALVLTGFLREGEREWIREKLRRLAA